MNITPASGGKEALPHVQRAVALLESARQEQPHDATIQYRLGLAYSTAGDLVMLGTKSPPPGRGHASLYL